jgi:hypothetical protein
MESKPRKRRPHPARRSRRIVGAGSVAAMLTLTGGLAFAGAPASGTASSSKASANTKATTDTTVAAATSATAGAVSSQPNTVSSGS